MTSGQLQSPVAPRRDRLIEVRDPRLTFDAMLAVGFALGTALPYVNSSVPIFLGSIVLSATLATRRIWPAVTLAVATAACLAMALVEDRPFTAVVIVPLLVYSLARWSERRMARLALAAGVLGSVIGPIRWDSSLGGNGHVLTVVVLTGLTCLGLVGGPYLVGRRRRESVQQGEYRDAARREQQRLQLAEQQQRARAATMDERSRIARELHDIVAHSLSVIVVQAEGGKALAARRPERAPEVLDTIAETSREALVEMRQMVGLLRSGGPLDHVRGGPLDHVRGGPLDQASGRDLAEDDKLPATTGEDYRPAPGLTELPDLVRKTTDRARLQISGEVPSVPRPLGLTVYRIVQESLTNVLKHAGPQARAVVRLDYRPDRIDLEVRDDGVGAAADGDGLGHGLQGMRERASLHGGTVSAGPAAGGGFVVRASLPCHPSLDHGLVDSPQAYPNGRWP